MKILFMLMWQILCCAVLLHAQQISPVTEQQFENNATVEEGNTEDDSWIQDLEKFRKHPVNMNTAEQDELLQLHILSALQIENLLAYRHLYGHFISVYELQAVPGLETTLIRQLLPFITTAEPKDLPASLRSRFRHGDQMILIRFGYTPGKNNLYNDSVSGHYEGNPLRMMFRYKYAYKNLMQFGLTGDKDAGEPFLKGRQKMGFDFYSLHFFSRHTGLVRTIALGDFTVNMGQGLIQWQSLAFRKSAEVMSVKRQSAVLRPYSSSGEYGFYRGAGLELRKGKMIAALFYSYRKISTNLIADSSGFTFISSVLLSGYHRNTAENEDRNNSTQTVIGGMLGVKQKKWHLNFNAVNYKYGNPIQKRDEPYNLYAFRGTHGFNASADYSFTYKNMHFFGEAAVDMFLHKAFVNGILVSADPKVDISILYRNIHSAYTAPAGNAFTESSLPVNEKGFYIGSSIRPVRSLRIDMYADVFRFPWIRYLKDAPSGGAEYLIQFTYTPSKQIEIYTRFRIESKQADISGNNAVTDYLIYSIRKNWRTQVNYKLSKDLQFRNRIEYAVTNGQEAGGKGFLGFTDFVYKPMLKPYGGIFRLQYFETDGYDSRVYAFENDLLYSFSIPAFFDKGFRYYLIINYDIAKNCSAWVRLAQSFYPGTKDGRQISPRHFDNDLKIQLIWQF